MELPEGEEHYKMKLITRDCCFFCLKTDNIRQSDDESFSSMEYLLRHLKINLSGSSSSNEGQPILASLCKSCEKMNARFSKLSQNLEKIQMELNYILRSINFRISDSAKDVALVENYSKRMTSDLEALSQLAVVDKLRKDLANNCLEKQVGPIPCIKLHRSENNQNIKTIKNEIVEDCNPEEDFCDGQADTFLDTPSQSHDLFPADTKVEVDSLPAKKSHKVESKETSPKLSFFKDPSTGFFHCKKCDKSYQYNTSIRRHYERVHLKRRFKCDICNISAFAQLSYLIIHKQTCRKNLPKVLAVEKEKQKFEFVCGECKKKFKTKADLNNHRLRVHTSVGRYPCDLCDKKFKRPEHLRNHKDAVHFGKRFNCGFCSKSFPYKHLMRTHEKKCMQKLAVKDES